MKRKVESIISILIIILMSQSLKAQSSASCTGFAKEGFTVLDTAIYTHDGRYNSLKLSQGDKIEVYKPFYKGRTYKIVVSSEDNLSGMTFKIVNIQKATLYESKTTDNVQYWEYTPEKNENLIITVEIPAAAKKDGDAEQTIESGCVAVIVGYKTS